MNEIQIFNNPDFGEVRTLTENGAVLFCGSDVAKALGYAVPRKALFDHCKGVLKRNIPTNGGTQEMSFIPESDLYRLVFSSKLPTAEKFTDWVTSEVLPSIRKTGMYLSPKIDSAMLYRVAQELEAKEKEVIALTAENERQRQVIQDYEPRMQYLDTILSSRGTMATTQIAADYDLTPQKLNKILHAAGIQHNVNGQWILYRKHMGMGYTKSETIPITRSDGRPDTKIFTRWTQKGRLLIHEILTGHGIQAAMDRDPNV